MGKISHTLKVEHRPEIGGTVIKKFEAVLPNKKDDKVFDGAKDLSFMKITWNGQTVYLKKASLKQGSDTIFISESWLKEMPEFTPCEIIKSSRFRYYIFKLRRDFNEKTLLWGLILSLIGLGIDAALSIGKIDFSSTIAGIRLPVVVSADFIVMLTAIAYVTKIVGLILMFWKGAREA